MNVIQISTNSSAGKSVIFIDAGIHAREWIAPAVTLYAINQLVENKENAKLLEEVDWHILPVVNPDGYEYTHGSFLVSTYYFHLKSRPNKNFLAKILAKDTFTRKQMHRGRCQSQF